MDYSPWGHKESDMIDRLSLSLHSQSIRIKKKWIKMKKAINPQKVRKFFLIKKEMNRHHSRNKTRVTSQEWIQTHQQKFRVKFFYKVRNSGMSEHSRKKKMKKDTKKRFKRKKHTMKILLLLSRFSRVQLCATPQTAAHQAPLSTGFSRREYWSGLPFPSPMKILTSRCWSDITSRQQNSDIKVSMRTSKKHT